MTTRRTTKSKQSDPLESAIERALRPDDFIEYNSCWSFVSDLETVKKQIDDILRSNHGRAIELVETFLAGCYEKSEEIDDSSGHFGMFVSDLYCSWVKARQQADSDPDETAARLLAWMDDDPYGYAYDLEKDVSKVLNKKGLKAFAASVRARFNLAGTDTEKEKKQYEHKRWGQVLKTIYATGRDLKSFVLICEDTELLPSDCEIIAGMLVSRRKPEEALQWVEKGMALEKNALFSRGSSYKLDTMKRQILTKLGRGREALESAWQNFKKFPNEFSYDEFMNYIPKNEQQEWYRHALDITKNADLDPAVTLLLKINEMDILVERIGNAQDIDLEKLSHFTTEPVAEKLAGKHPDIAARVFRALGMRIVKAKKSKYYGAAHSHFEKAKRCYEKANLDSLWQNTVEEVRRDHSRKSSFMPGFERVVAGKGPSTQPSFLERAKNRWKKHG